MHCRDCNTKQSCRGVFSATGKVFDVRMEMTGHSVGGSLLSTSTICIRSANTPPSTIPSHVSSTLFLPPIHTRITSLLVYETDTNVTSRECNPSNSLSFTSPTSTDNNRISRLSPHSARSDPPLLPLSGSMDGM